MPTEQAKTTDRPAVENRPSEDNIASYLQSLPSQPANVQTPAPSEESSFLLDSVVEDEPQESAAFTWFVRIVVGLGLIAAAIVAGWLTISSIQEFVG